jgi:hypothetical protein
MEKYLAALLVCVPFVAGAQSPIPTQSRHERDICADATDPMTNEDIYACAMDALSDHHYAVALKWFRRGASRGDYYAQFELGTMYEEGSGVTTDFVQAYEWFEIAAATHEACKGQRPPSPLPETTQVEITYRDGVAKQMNQTQIETAQRLARKWKPSGQAWKWDAAQGSYIKAQSGC